MRRILKIFPKQQVKRPIARGIIAAAAVALIAACQPAGRSVETASVRSAHAPEKPSTPLQYGKAVASWQLAAFDDLSYLPTFVADSAYERGWVKAAFYIGLERYARQAQDKTLFAVLERVSRSSGFDLGRQPWHADDQAIAAVYARVAARMGKPELLGNVRKEFDAILADRATGSLEFLPGSISEGGCQRRWCWADALFMGPPSWAEMTIATGDEKYRQYAAEETRATIEYLFDPETHLFFRDSRYFDKTTKNGKKVFWSRGNGWVFAGLARFIEALPADHPERDYFIGIFRKMAAALVTIQRDDGYWPTSLHDAGLFPGPETSGTGFFGFGLAWGLNNGILSGPKYERATEKAWAAMVAAVDSEGKLGWVQQVGKDPQLTTRESSQIYGAGAFLLMAAEMAKRER